MSMPGRWPSPRSRRCVRVPRRSCPRVGKRPISTGWRTSSPGACRDAPGSRFPRARRGPHHRHAIGRPLGRSDRAVPDRPMVCRCRDAGQARDRGGAFGCHDDRAQELGKDLFQLDGEHPALVRVAMLQEADFLERVEDRTIATPLGDRSGEVIEPCLTDQWYVDAGTLAKPAIEAVRSGATTIVPKSWEKTYFNWMENIQPWCVSRCSRKPISSSASRTAPSPRHWATARAK